MSPGSIEWQGQTYEFTRHTPTVIDPTDRLPDAETKQEVDCLSHVAQLAKADALELLWHPEARDEFNRMWSVPSGGSPELLHAKITYVRGPFPYPRASPRYEWENGKVVRDRELDLLMADKDERFLQLQKACGALQGATKNVNQVLDAFHIWCAEVGGATHFLTTDKKLIRLIHGHKTFPPKVKIISPCDLVSEVYQGH